MATTIFGFLIIEASTFSQWWMLQQHLQPLEEKLNTLVAQDPASLAETVQGAIAAYFEANDTYLVAFGSSLVLALVMAVPALVLARLTGRGGLRSYLPFARVSLPAVIVGIGCALFYWVGTTLANLIFTVEVASESVREEVIPALIVAAVNAIPLWMLLLSHVLIIPVAEEVFCRGFLMRGYLGTDPSRLRIVLAVLATAAAYGLAHVQYSLVAVAELAGFGILLGVARVWSGSLWLPIAMHVAYNGFASAASAWLSA